MTPSGTFMSKVFETDQYLIDQIVRHQNKPAAETLVERHYKTVYREIYLKTSDQELAMDLTQETFISILKALPQYDAKKASFKTWIVKIAHNKVIDYRRSRQHHESLLTEVLEDYDQDDGSDLESNVMNKITKEQVDTVLNAEDEKSRNIFKMKAQQGYTFTEISEITGTAKPAVKSRYYSMIKRMRKELQDYE